MRGAKPLHFSAMARLFIAMELPADVRQELAAVQQRLARRAPGLRWVAADQMHLTLVFLGETPDERQAGVQQAMDAAVAGVPPLELALGNLGTFGRPEAPRVIWVALQGPPALAALQARLAGACAALGIPADPRPFTPHLTLGRARREGGERLPARFAEGIVPSPTPFRAGGIVLFESRLGSGGPAYQAWHVSPFDSLPRI